MLQSLTIVDFTWEELSEGSQRTLMQLCQKITSLSLHVWCAPEGVSSAKLIPLLQVGRSLRKLYLINSCISGGKPHHPSEAYDLNRPDSAQAMSSITSISITGSCLGAYVPALLSAFTFPRLTEVALEYITQKTLNSVMSFLRACSPTLEHLRLTVGGLLRGSDTESTRQHELWNDNEGARLAVCVCSLCSPLTLLVATRSLHVPRGTDQSHCTTQPSSDCRPSACSHYPATSPACQTS